MSDEEEILYTFKKYGVDIHSPITQPSGGTAHYLILVTAERDSSNHQIPSNATLMKIASVLAENGKYVDIVIHDKSLPDAENAIRATLLHSFPDLVRNSFLSYDTFRANVWIEPKRTLDELSLNKITDKVHASLSILSLPKGFISIIGDENTPSMLLLLRTIRKFAPIDEALLSYQVSQLGFSIPSANWLSRKLDNLRKSQRLTRSKDGKYSLTLDAIKSLGTSKGRRSPDISRLLALARSRQ